MATEGMSLVQGPPIRRIPSPSCYGGCGAPRVELGWEGLGGTGVDGVCALSSLKEAQGGMPARGAGGDRVFSLYSGL